MIIWNFISILCILCRTSRIK